MIHWAYILLASLSWTFAFRQYVSQDRQMSWYAVNHAQWWLLGAALLLAVIGLRRRANGPGSGQTLGPTLARWHFVLIAPLGMAMMLAEAPYRPAMMLTMVGILLLTGPARLRFAGSLRRLGLAALVLGVIGIAQSPAYWLVTSWTATNPRAPMAATVLHAVLTWLGCDTSLSGGVLHVRTMRHEHAFPITWDYLALYPFLLTWVGGAVLLWLDQRPVRRLRRLTMMTLVLIACALARFVLALLVFLTAMLFVGYYEDTIHVELFWLPELTALTMLPFIVVLGRWAPFGRRGPLPATDGPHPTWIVKRAGVSSALSWNTLGRRGRAASCCILTVLACLVVTMRSAFFDRGDKKPGRVLLDESHSRWERSDRKYDTDWYGHHSGYNYAAMADYIGHYYDLTTHLDGPLTEETLDQCDVLILKTPTEPFSETEINAIDAFVQRGGGLFALGEHTNVFGTSVCLNAVLRRFGMALHYDSVFDIEHKWEQVYFPPRYARHPAAIHVPFFRYAVSCSIDSDSWQVQPVLRATGLWSLPIEYAASNFYPQVVDHTYARFGAHDQCLSTTHGKGRVLAFGDSTVYSNFLAFYPGKPEFLIGGLEWLNRSNTRPWMPTACLIFLAILLIALIHRHVRRPIGLDELTSATVCCAAVVWLALWGFTRTTAAAYPWPEPRRAVQTVVFDVPHSDIDLPIFGFTQDYARSYEVFYEWVMRLGYFPKAVFNLNDLSPEDVLVIVRPRRGYTDDDLGRIQQFVERGGKLLVMDEPAKTPPTGQQPEPSTAGEVLSRFDLALSDAPCRGRSIIEVNTKTPVCSLARGVPVQGGDALLTTEAGEPIAAWRRVGKGLVVAAGLSERFGDPQMGGSIRAIPTGELRAAYELEFALLRGMVKDDLAGELTRLGQTYSATAK